ncbi:MAG: acyl-CoA reductase [Gemmatimonadales bacterium]|jgi:hypothetical protein
MADGAKLNGYWLPELGGVEIETRERPFGPGHVLLSVPALTAHTLREVLVRLRENRATYLAGLTVDEVLGAIEAAACRLTEPGEAVREELVTVLPELTGYSPQMIAIGLERMGRGWTAKALRGALEAEFGDPAVLDDFRPRQPHGQQRAIAAPLTVHIFSGNIPGVSVSSLIRALCVKSASFGKTAAGEPYLAVCFARALAETDPDIGRCLAVSYWPGGSDDLEAVAFSQAGTVIAYGSDETVSDIRHRVPPDVGFLAYPSRVGVALISRNALSEASVPGLARRAALDVVTFDQQGCVSPHTIYVERGGRVDPLGFARELAAALAELAIEIPRGVMAPAESSLIHQARAQAEVRGATVLASQRGTEWTVIVEEGTEFNASPLNRLIQVAMVDRLADVLEALRPVGGHLQTVAIAADANEIRLLATSLADIGATRIVSVGEAAWPAPHWHHDGRFQFLELVRFVDLEVT